MPQNESSLPDEEVVALALSEKAYFGHIVTRYENKLASYIRRLGIRNEEDRQDVLQNIFIKVYKNLYGFDTSLSFSSWIYRIAHNEAISFYRMNSVRPEGHLVDKADEILSFISSAEESQEKMFDSHINAQEVSAALEALDSKYRDALILRFFEHKEYDEISDILKIPIGTVGTLIHRGKQELKKHLEESHLHI
jgi:RNA polymerase sigma-70 factor (ECF subfamily)